MKIIRSAFPSLLAGVAGFVAVAMVLQRIDPLRGVPDIKIQAERVLRHPDTTTIFFGSSLTRRGIDPSAFDQRLSELSISAKSLNCGVDAMTMPEVLFLLDLVLQRSPPTLRWVVLEASPIRATARNPSEATIRGIYWRTMPLTVAAIQKLLISPPTPPQAGASTQFQQVANHGALWLRRFVNLGRIGEFTGHIPSTGLPPLADRVGEHTFYSDERGFLGIDLEVPPDQRPMLSKGIAGILPLWEKASEDTVGAQLLLRRIRQLERIGVKLILVQPPDTHRPPAPFPSLAKHGVVELNFMQPEQYPGLYMPEHRYDTRHLNKKGAKLFSKQLAEAFADIVKTGR